MKMPTPKAAGTWDFYGACAPSEDSSLTMQDTFTLGCFQWEPMARGKGTKKGKVKYRVKGNASDPKQAYDQARHFCARKNEEAFGADQ